jgi:Cu/Ag efflux protein CusF
MKSKLLLWIILAAPLAIVAADKPASDAKTADAVKRHPLKGVITGILVEKSALLVKHEEVPGVMRAMTMMFKVDAATLKAAKEGQAITGLMSRQGDSWVLEQVKFVDKKKG